MAKRDRGTGGLFKMPNSRFYYAQVYQNGKQRRISTRTEVKVEAQVFLRNLLSDSDAGKPFAGDVKKVTYGNLRAGLLQNYTEKGNKSLLVDADGEEFINGLKPLDFFFGFKSDDPGVPVTKMTTDAARKFAQERIAEGVTNSTVNNSLALLRRMLHIAHEDGKISIVPKIRLLKANPARKGFVKLEQFNILISHLPVHLRPLVTFLYYCGVRLGEATAVTWSQVDFTGPVIRLEAEQTKSDAARIIPLPDVLVRMLKVSDSDGDLVFDSTNFRKEWAKACVAAGLGVQEPVDKAGNRRYTGLVPHDLRRSAIKNLMKMGVQQKVAMKISGHTTDSVFNRYNIIDESDVLAAMKRVEIGSVKGNQTLVNTSVRVLPSGEVDDE